MIVIDNDGLNVGLADSFGETWLEFDEEDAYEIARIWNEFLNPQAKDE
jgi:hypothetical protein